ncbi:RNA polymerase sigma factor [candidate division KSB1 bacterium]
MKNGSHAEIVRKIQRNRDMAAFQQLVLAYQEKLYYLIRKMVYSHEDSQDLLQEVFIRALKKIDKLREPEKFNSWIYNIAVNMVIDFKRKQHWNGLK